MKKYKIGEIAKILGTTTQTLRFYEQEGIVVPKKSENGTRYYTEADIVRLMAFKRFRLSEFTVQDVARHFKKGNLQKLTEQLEEQSKNLIAQSEALLRRARAISRFEKMLREAHEKQDELCCLDRPKLYMHACTLGQMDQLSEAQRQSFEAYMNAMPSTHICFIYDEKKQPMPEFRFTVSQKDAESWELPLESALTIPSGRCVRIFVRTDGRLWEGEYLKSLVKRVEEAGYRADENFPIIGQQLASESGGEKGYLIAALYIPVL